MTRFQNWPELLAEYIERKRHEPFAWGVNDCSMFAADWVRLCTGLDPAEGVRGTYATALAGVRIVDQAGGAEGIMQKHFEPLGLAAIAAGTQGRGDIVMMEAKHGQTLGVCIGAVAAFVAESGLNFQALASQSARFWRI